MLRVPRWYILSVLIRFKKEYTEKVKEGTETGSFDTYLKSEMDKQIGYAGSFDGMITEYKGNNPIYMSAEQKAEAKKYQDIFFSAVLTEKLLMQISC